MYAVPARAALYSALRYLFSTMYSTPLAKVKKGEESYILIQSRMVCFLDIRFRALNLSNLVSGEQGNEKAYES